MTDPTTPPADEREAKENEETADLEMRDMRLKHHARVTDLKGQLSEAQRQRDEARSDLASCADRANTALRELGLDHVQIDDPRQLKDAIVALYDSASANDRLVQDKVKDIEALKANAEREIGILDGRVGSVTKSMFHWKERAVLVELYLREAKRELESLRAEGERAKKIDACGPSPVHARNEADARAKVMRMKVDKYRIDLFAAALDEYAAIVAQGSGDTNEQ